jgi:hypothetical protein
VRSKTQGVSHTDKTKDSISTLFDSILNALGCPDVISDAAEAAKELGIYAKDLYKGIKVNDATSELLHLCMDDSESGQTDPVDCEIRVRQYLEKQLNSNKCFMGLPSQMLAIRRCYDCPEGEQIWATWWWALLTFLLPQRKIPADDRKNMRASPGVGD